MPPKEKEKTEKLEVETPDPASDPIKDLNEWEAGLKAKEETLGAREEEIELKEKALAEQSRPDAPKPPAVHRKAVRYMCVRECYAPVNPDQPATCKLFQPGEKVIFFEDQKHKISRHFKPIPNKEVEDRVAAEAEKNLATDLPDFIKKRQKNVMEHG